MQPLNVPRASFSAVAIGALIAVVIDTGFGLLGAAFGLSPAQAGGLILEGNVYVAIGAAFLAGALSFCSGGYVAGRLAAPGRPWYAAVHGMGAFALALMGVVYFSGESNFNNLAMRASIQAAADQLTSPVLLRTELNHGLVVANLVSLGLFLSGAAAASVGGLLGMRAGIRQARKERKERRADSRTKPREQDAA